MSRPMEETLFVKEFVATAEKSRVFGKGLNSKKLLDFPFRNLDLLIRALPKVNNVLALSPYANYTWLVHETPPASRAIPDSENSILEFVCKVIREYERILQQNKRNFVRAFWDSESNHSEHFSSDEKVSATVLFILVHFACEYYRVFQAAFKSVRTDKSAKRAIIKGARDLAQMFVDHVGQESEPLPDYLLESFFWSNEYFGSKMVRGMMYLWGNYEFHDDELNGITFYNFHTLSITVFPRRDQGQSPTFWARRSDLAEQAGHFGKRKDFLKGQYCLKLLRRPFPFELEQFCCMVETHSVSFREHFVDITSQLQESAPEFFDDVFEPNPQPKLFDENGNANEVGIESGSRKEGVDNISETVRHHFLCLDNHGNSELQSTMLAFIDSLTTGVLKEAVKWRVEIESELKTIAATLLLHWNLDVVMTLSPADLEFARTALSNMNNNLWPNLAIQLASARGSWPPSPLSKAELTNRSAELGCSEGLSLLLLEPSSSSSSSSSTATDSSPPDVITTCKYFNSMSLQVNDDALEVIQEALLLVRDQL